MANSKSIDLFLLVKSLSKSEKRSFRLYAERAQSSDQLVYMQLFDILDKEKECDDEKIMKALGVKGSTNYSNYKRHLYEQLLVSLRMVQKFQNSNFKVRELIDFAYVLYGKGFHIQALKTLMRARGLAEKYKLDFALMTILEFEKRIHARHITRIDTKSMHDIMELSSNVADNIYHRSNLSNLSLKLHREYILKGHAMSEAEAQLIKDEYESKLFSFEESDFDMLQKINYYQAQIWYNYLTNDLKATHLVSKKSVQIFDLNKWTEQELNIFFRASHYYLISLFNLKKKSEFKAYLAKLEHFRKSNYSKFNENAKILSFMTVHQGRLNQFILNGDYQAALLAIPKTLKRLARYKAMMDIHKIMIFNFKLAWIYLMAGKPEKSVAYIQSIINQSQKSLKKDIQVFARLMNLMIQIDLGNDYLILSLVRSYKHFITKNKMMLDYHKWSLQFTKNYISTPLYERKALTKKYYNLLDSIADNKYEKRAFLYLDFRVWMKLKM